MDCRTRQETELLLSRINPVLKFGETGVSLIDNTNKRKRNEDELETESKKKVCSK
jgi:hypothetical protein